MTATLFAGDLWHATRLLSKHRAVNVGIILTLGLILGAATCIFAILYGAVVRQLPFPAADRLVMLRDSNKDTHVQRLPVTEGAYRIIVLPASNARLTYWNANQMSGLSGKERGKLECFRHDADNMYR